MMSDIPTHLNLTGQSFLKESDYTREDLNRLIDMAIDLKQKKQDGEAHTYLQNKNIALLFEKSSTRTRAAFTVAANDLGANVEYLNKNDLQLGQKESIKDTALVLGRLFDGIAYRGYAHTNVETLAKYANIPIWNGLTNEWHPTQSLADFMTMKEHFDTLEDLTVTYLGDGRNNVARSLMIAAAILGVNIRICAPTALQPDTETVELARQFAEQHGSEVSIMTDPHSAVKQADVLYTDVWVSMGEEEHFEERLDMLQAYQVNEELLQATGKKDTIFLHCLPAFHNTETSYGQEIAQKYGIEEMEVTDQVFYSDSSKVFDQAENRLHTIKAVILASMK